MHDVVRNIKAGLSLTYGFDELMAQFAELFRVPNLHEELENTLKQTCQQYKDASRTLVNRFAYELAERTRGAERKCLMRAAVYHTKHSVLKDEWGYWEIQVRAADTSDERKDLYEEGISAIGRVANEERIDPGPKVAPLLGNYARFLKNERNDRDAAAEYFKRAIEADPKNANNLRNYAVFLNNERRDPDAAENYFRRAIEEAEKADLRSAADFLADYARFLNNERKDLDAAEKCFRRAIKADPDDADILRNYADFLTDERKDLDAAERYFKRAIKKDDARNRAICLAEYAVFLNNERNDPESANKYFERAIAADPKNVEYLVIYSRFLKIERDDHKEADRFQALAIEIDPERAKEHLESVNKKRKTLETKSN